MWMRGDYSSKLGVGPAAGLPEPFIAKELDKGMAIAPSLAATAQKLDSFVSSAFIPPSEAQKTIDEVRSTWVSARPSGIAVQAIRSPPHDSDGLGSLTEKVEAVQKQALLDVKEADKELASRAAVGEGSQSSAPSKFSKVLSRGSQREALTLAQRINYQRALQQLPHTRELFKRHPEAKAHVKEVVDQFIEQLDLPQSSETQLLRARLKLSLYRLLNSQIDSQYTLGADKRSLSDVSDSIAQQIQGTINVNHAVLRGTLPPPLQLKEMIRKAEASVEKTQDRIPGNADLQNMKLQFSNLEQQLSKVQSTLTVEQRVKARHAINQMQTEFYRNAADNMVKMGSIFQTAVENLSKPEYILDKIQRGKIDELKKELDMIDGYATKFRMLSSAIRSHAPIEFNELSKSVSEVEGIVQSCLDNDKIAYRRMQAQ